MPVIDPFTSALNLTPTSTAEPSASLAVTGVAVDGQIVHAEQLIVAGVTAFEGEEAGPVPTEFVAETVKVYEVPLVSPVTLTLEVGGLPATVTGVCATPAA